MANAPVKETARSLERDARSLMGTSLAKDITPVDIRDVLCRVVQRGAAVQANRLRSHLRAAFQWGVYHDNDPRSMGAEILFELDRNPVDDVPKDASVESAGDRALSWDEIAQVWNDEKLPLFHRLAVQLILASGGQRPGEVTEARFEEFDRDARLWVLPPERTKNKRYHLVPLTELALAIFERLTCLNSLQGPYLFPARGERPRPRTRACRRRPWPIVGSPDCCCGHPRTCDELSRRGMGEVGIQNPFATECRAAA